MKSYHKIFITTFLTIILLLGFAIPVNMVGNWYQQFMPNLNGRQITDITFTDSLYGYAITSRLTLTDTSFILKTTNSGDNWFFSHSDSSVDYNRIQFINQNTGFVGGYIRRNSSYWIVKTTDRGSNWFYINAPADVPVSDMSVLDENTLWLASSSNPTGGVFYTSNGGGSWDWQLNLGSQNPVKIYMYNGNTGFIAKNTGASYTRKTTNSGVSWDTIPGENGFFDMYFTDILTGWKASGVMKKTTNGGLNWVQQTIPFGGNLIGNALNKFSVLNADTLWGIGGEIIVDTQTRGIIYRTVNGGQNWQFQIPDTAIYVNGPYTYLQFVNSKCGWAYTLGLLGGIHTTTGGDPIWLTGIKQISTEIPKEYKLFQNYPNPFNPKTNIKYQIINLSSSALIGENKYQNKTNVKLIIYDINGKEIIKLVNEQLQPGTYEVDFSGSGYSSGVFFYTLTADNKVIATKKMVLLK